MTPAQEKKLDDIGDTTNKLLMIVGGDEKTKTKGLVEDFSDHKKDDIVFHDKIEGYVNQGKGALGLIMFILAVLTALIIFKPDKTETQQIYSGQTKSNRVDTVYIKDR